MRHFSWTYNFKDDLKECRCLCCNKDCQQVWQKLNKFSNHNYNKFVLLFQKGVYPNEYMHNWEKFNETSLSEKVDVFENFRNMCFKIYELDPEKLLPAAGLAWKAALKQTKAKLDLLTDVYRLLMVEKGIRGGNVTLFIDMQKIIKNTWKIIIKIKSCHMFNIGM